MIPLTRHSGKVPPTIDNRIIHIEMENDHEESSYYSSIPKNQQSHADSNLYPIVQGLRSIDGDHPKIMSTYNDDPEPERPPAKGAGEISETLGSDPDMLEIKVT